MKLYEEFKLFEDMWDDEDLETSVIYAIGDTTSYKLKVDNSTKNLEASGVSKNQAFKAIMTFILGLTPEEIDNLSINWVYDYHKPGDADGDPVFQLESLSEFCEMEECSIDSYDIHDFDQNRYLQNWCGADNHIATALLTALDLPLWGNNR